MATRSVSKTENPGSNPGSPAPNDARRRYWFQVHLRCNLRTSVAVGAAGIVAALIALAAPPIAGAACAGKRATPESISADKAESAVLCLFNRKRAKRNLPRLARHRQLDEPALGHSRYMVQERCFAHRCRGEPGLEERLREYLERGGQAWGQNIAWGSGEFGSPQAVVRSWMRSEGHRRNILSRDYEHIGIGIVWGSPEGPVFEAATYTTTFGARTGRGGRR